MVRVQVWNGLRVKYGCVVSMVRVQVWNGLRVQCGQCGCVVRVQVWNGLRVQCGQCGSVVGGVTGVSTWIAGRSGCANPKGEAGRDVGRVRSWLSLGMSTGVFVLEVRW